MNPHLAWAADISDRYALRDRSIVSSGGVVRHLDDSSHRIFLVRQKTAVNVQHEHRHVLTVAPKVELTVAVHRRVESELVERLVLQGQRREPEQPGQPPSAPATASQGARADVRSVVVQKFQPVQRQVVAAPAGPEPLPARDLPPQVMSRPPLWPEQARPQPPIVDEQRLAEKVIQEIDRRGIARRERAVEHFRSREERM